MPSAAGTGSGFSTWRTYTLSAVVPAVAALLVPLRLFVVCLYPGLRLGHQGISFSKLSIFF